MNTAAASLTSPAYTPLECLLLFQALAAYGTSDNDFAAISDLLTNNGLIKTGPTYDPQRLSVDALRQLYVHLVHVEDTADGLEREADEGHGAQSPSRKRKLPSPQRPSLKDAQQYKDRLPVLVDRLYARYRDYMVHAIREDERRYAAVQKEIQEIERGEWDERILKEAHASAKRDQMEGAAIVSEPPHPKPNGTASVKLPTPTPTPTPQQLPPQQVPTQERKPIEVPTAEATGPAVVAAPTKISPTIGTTSPRIEARPDGLAITDVLNTQQPPAPSPPQPQPQAVDVRPQNGAPNARPSPKTQQRPGSKGSYVLHGPTLQPQPSAHQPGNVWKWEQPYGPQHQPPQYQGSSPHPPSFNTPQYQQGYVPPPRGSFSTPHGLPPPHPHVPSSPSPLNPTHPHPILLPPPNGVRRSPGSPGMPLDALADIAGQQYRASAGSPMAQQQMPGSPAGYPQQFPPRPAPQNPPPQWNQPYPPPYPGSPQQYPKFHASSGQRLPYPPRPDLVPPENRQYNSPYNANQVPKPAVPLISSMPAPKPKISQPSTPVSQGTSRFKTGSDTRWTPTPTSSTPKPSKTVPRPDVEPLSPVLRPAKLSQPTKKSPPKQEVPKQPEPSKAVKPPRRGTQAARAGSAASSIVTGSHRSPSATPHVDENLLENELPARHVKQEVATPIGIEDAGDTTADESSSLVPTHNLRTGGHHARDSSKRKRVGSPAFKLPSPSIPPTHVLWTRAFPKISASALEAISGHRNASTFAAPVKERDAPGYRHLILRPQDLKSIRSAIHAGHRAAAAAAPSDLDASQPSILLPISEELIPPKGIINNTQLEKELMRMFANAIMFNADPDRGFGRTLQDKGKPQGDVIGYEIDEDSLVKDTRAMFADVEKIITNLRSAERRSEELRESGISTTTGNAGGTMEGDSEAGESAADREEGSASNTGSIAKRRRKN